MIRGVAFNLDQSGVPAAVAGPYVRGDFGTIRKHLETLRESAPEVLPLYRELARTAVPFAVEKGAYGEPTAQEIYRLIDQFDDR
jgi:predicted short-subunit dehydrogenase-like oxidoreductase (DUF2520 family)